MEWLFANAKNYTDVLVFLGAGGAAAGWAWRMILQSKKAVSELVNAIADIKKQLVTNGGSSLFDVVKDTRNQVTSMTSDLQRVKAWQWSFSQASKMPMWESDERGCWCRVNIAMQDLTGRAGEQLHNSGWENAIPPSPERSEVWHAWQDAVQRAREFEHSYTVVHAGTHKKWRVKAVATPVISAGVLAGFVGRFETVTEDNS